jgi:FAD synthetase
MSLEALVSKYIASTEKVLKEMQQTEGSISVAEESVDNILSYVTAYLEDAKYYKAQKRFETSLTSVAYCEGLLDALRLLGAVKFEWPAKAERKR